MSGISRTARRLGPATVVVGATLVSLGLLLRVAPGYLAHGLFPDDGAWVHLVLGRSLATSGRLFFNPGIPVTGGFSPAWATLVALPTLLAGPHGAGVVLATKGLGLALELAAALVLLVALRAPDAHAWLTVAGAALVAASPNLVAASVSGLATPLAVLASVLLLWSVLRGGPGPVVAAAALAVLTRPELAVLCLVLPPLAHPRDRVARRRAGIAAVAGGAVAATAWIAWVVLVGDRRLGPTLAGLLPPAGSLVQAELTAFITGLDRIPVVGSGLLVAGLLAAGLHRLRHGTGPEPAAAAVLGGLALVVVAVAYHVPTDASTLPVMIHALPGAALVLAGAPELARQLVRWFAAERHLGPATWTLLALFAFGTLARTPARFRRLASAATNAEGIQVAEGRRLARAAPTDVVWAESPGTLRYFGRAFVVDLTGRLGAPPATTRGDRDPGFLEVVAGRGQLDPSSARTLPRRRFAVTWPREVPDFQRAPARWLVACQPPGWSGTLAVGTGRRSFRCAGAPDWAEVLGR